MLAPLTLISQLPFELAISLEQIGEIATDGHHSSISSLLNTALHGGSLHGHAGRASPRGGRASDAREATPPRRAPPLPSADGEVGFTLCPHVPLPLHAFHALGPEPLRRATPFTQLTFT